MMFVGEGDEKATRRDVLKIAGALARAPLARQ
jgi:hypothetical protein